MMKLTQHAKERKIQRNIPDAAIDIILKNGRISHTPGGTMKVFLGNKETNEMVLQLKTMIKTLERARGGTLIVTEEEALTVYRSH